MNEQFVQVDGTRVCFEVFGSSGPTVVLVMGLNLQFVWWKEAFCQALVDRGLRVVRFDNRDVGRSSTFAATRVTAWQFVTRRGVRPTYGLPEMARDTAGLIRHVAPQGAHVVGASLGAFVAQETAIRYPELVRSLTSVMGRPGDGRTGKVAWAERGRFLSAPAADLDAQAEELVRTFRAIGSTGRTELDDQDVRDAVRCSAGRGAQGSPNQLAAVLTEQDRTAGLRQLRMPALVVHGTRDRIVLPSGGVATAHAISGAELMMIPQMGHDLPRWVWPQLITAIAGTIQRAERP